MNHINDLVIIGISHHNTLSMIRSVGHEGVKPYVILYGHTKSYIEYSKYIAGYKHVETAEEAVEALVSFSRRAAHKPIVITCSDEISMILDRHYDELCSLCYFFNAGEKGRVTRFMDKQVQTTLAKECGFSTPWSIECLPGNTPYEEVQYPCIVKPKESVHGGKKLFVCYNVEELKISLKEFDAKYAVIIQQYIKGEYEVVIIGLTISGHSIIPGFAKKHRDYKGATTYSTIYPISDISRSVVTAAEQMLRQIKYEGLRGIECNKIGANYYFIELNMRNDATTYSMTTAGVNLPMIYYQTHNDDNYVLNTTMRVETINSMVEFDDFNFVLKRVVSLRRWKKQLNDCKCHYYFDKDDKAPYRAKRKEYIRFLINRLFHKA